MTHDRDESLMTSLDECLAELAAGADLDSCLAAHPDHATELAGLIEVALALDALRPPGPSPSVARQAKVAFLTQVDQAAVAEPGLATRIIRYLRPRFVSVPTAARALATTTVVLVVVLLLSGGMVYASTNSLPGDPLYPVKRLAEHVERVVTVGDYRRVALEQRLAQRRETELQQLLQQAQEETVIFVGPLQPTDSGYWLVDGVVVLVDSSTEVASLFESGVLVEVHGRTRPDGAVVASRIVSAQEEIRGTVQAIGTWRWQVAGKTILISLDSRVVGDLAVGDAVIAQARRFPGGVLMALTIERADGADDDFEPVPSTATPQPSAAPARELDDEPDGDSPPLTGHPDPTENQEPRPTIAPDDDEPDQDQESGDEADDDAAMTPAVQTKDSDDGGEDSDVEVPPPESTEDGESDDDGGGDDNDDGDDGEDADGENETTPPPEPTEDESDD